MANTNQINTAANAMPSVKRGAGGGEYVELRSRCHNRAGKFAEGDKSFSSYFRMEQAPRDPIFEYSPTVLPTMPVLRKTKRTNVISSRRGPSGG